MSELVLLDGEGEFLLVHGSDEYLSLARKPATSGEVPLVRFAPRHGAVVATALEAVMADPDAGPITVSVGTDRLRVAVSARPGARRLTVANLARRLPDSPEPEGLELDGHVVAETITALRGPRLAVLEGRPRSATLEDERGRVAGVEVVGETLVVSARTERSWARVEFDAGLRRVVASCLALVAANPGEESIRVAHIGRGRDQVLIERVATSTGAFPFTMANARPGRPARPRRVVRLSEGTARWVVTSLAVDEDRVPIDAGSDDEGPRVDVDLQAIAEDVEVRAEKRVERHTRT